MGLFKKIFGKDETQQQEVVTRFELINDAGGGFFEWDGKLYHSDIVRSCIRPKARAVGKLIAKHTRIVDNDQLTNPNNSMRILLEEPNPLMTMQILQEKMIMQLELNHNAFAYIKRDEFGNPLEIYPIFSAGVELIEGRFGDIYLKFLFQNGNKMTIPYSDIIHLRKDFAQDDFFGDSPGDALVGLMDVVTTVDQALTKAIKNSAIIKWLMKFHSVLKSEDRKKQVDAFIEECLSVKNGDGVAVADGRYDLQQVKNDAFIPDSAQNNATFQRIYNFFNTNEKIIQSKYTENEWNSYYESVIEPEAIQLAGEFTRKLFTKRERAFGNKIIFESSNLHYASTSTKLSLVQLVDRGAMTPNEWRATLGYGPIEGGDKPIRRLDTAEVKGGETIGKTTTDAPPNGNPTERCGD